MRDLPLNAIRAFEVAARTGSFSQAGVELNVTAAAVSQQVKALEGHYGKTLFLRRGNRITLTDAGRAIYPRLETALAEIAAVGADLREAQGRARLVLSCLPSLAESWLLPSLSGFDASGGLEVRVEEDPVTFARDGVDLRLTYGAHYYADHRIEVLFRDRLVPVGAPGFTLDGLATLPDTAFIHTDWGANYATEPSWANYFALVGTSASPDLGKGLLVGQTHLAVIAAREGLGVALVPARLAEGLIRSGRLVQVGALGPVMPREYVMIWPEAFSRRRSLMALIAHLRAAV